MMVSIKFLLFIGITLSLPAFAQDDEGEYEDEEERLQRIPLCTSKMSAEEFVRSNKEIFTFTKNPFDHIQITNAYKGNFSTNLEITNVQKGAWTNHKYERQITDYIWGLRESYDKKIVQLDTNNCFPRSKMKEFETELEKDNAKTLSPLANAVRSLDEALIKKLIDSKNFYLKDKSPDWKSFDKIAEFDPNLAVEMLRKGFPTEDKKLKESVLYTALVVSSVELAKEALKAKANPNFIPRDGGTTPLEAAILVGNPEIAELLISSGAKVEPRHLCYVEGHYTIKVGSDSISPESRAKVAEILLDKIPVVTLDCEKEKLSADLDEPQYRQVYRKMIEKGLKLNPKRAYPDHLLLTIWKTNPEINSAAKQKFESIKNGFKSLDPVKDRNAIGIALGTAIQFDDVEFFKAVIDTVKPNIQFKYKPEDYDRCTTDRLLYSRNEEMFQYALQNGMNPQFDCDGSGHSGNAPFIEEVINACQYPHLKLFSDEDILRASASEAKDNSKRHSEPTIFSCLETIRVLKSRGNGISDYDVMAPHLMTDNPKTVDVILRSGLITRKGLDQTVAKLDSISASDSIKKYFLVKMKKAKIKEPEKFPVLNLEFKVGEQYPLCSLEEEISSTLKNKHKSKKLPLCKQLSPESITYFEVKSVTPDQVSVIAVTSREHWIKPGIIFGEKLTLPRERLTTAEYFTLEGKNFPVSRLGMTAVTLADSKIVAIGKYNICERKNNLPLPKDAKITRLHNINIEKECVSNSGPE